MFYGIIVGAGIVGTVLAYVYVSGPAAIGTVFVSILVIRHQMLVQQDARIVRERIAAERAKPVRGEYRPGEPRSKFGDF